MNALRLLRNFTLYATGDGEFLWPHVGDLIEMNRILYSHWAVYVGDGEVVHLCGDDTCPVFSNVTKRGEKLEKAEVRIDKLKDVVGRSARVNNSPTFVVHMSNKLEFDNEPHPPVEIKKRALSELKLGKNGFSNCEHFAHWCRFGPSDNNQRPACGKQRSLQPKKDLRRQSISPYKFPPLHAH